MTPAPYYWLNGSILPIEHPQIHSLNRGFLLGHGVFETLLIPAHTTTPHHFSAHYSRLQQGCQFWDISIPSPESLLQEINRLLSYSSTETSTNTASPYRLRISAAQGYSSQSTLHMALYPISELPKNPKVISYQLSPYRRNEYSPLIGQKSLSYAENSAALLEAQSKGYHEALLLNTQGHLCEGSCSNLFLVKDNVLFTPSLTSGCLPGTARDLFLELAHSQGIQSKESSLNLRNLDEADEIFFTNAIHGVLTTDSSHSTAQRLYALWLKHLSQTC